MEGELQKIRDGILALMDKELIPSPGTDELKMSYYKMKSDYYRYLAECATDDAKGKATEDTCAAYAEATKIAEKDLVMNHPVRLAMALSSVVAQRQIPIDQTVQKTVETPLLQRADKVIDGPVVQVEHVPQSQVAEETVAIAQLNVVNKTAETTETQTIQGTQTSESLGTARVCRVAQAGTVKVVKIETPLLAESASPMFVSTPVSEALSVVVDTPVPQVVEEPAEASKAPSQNRVQHSSMEQAIANPAISLAEKTVEMPDTRTQEKTQHVVNTHVQHAVNTVEAEKPIINETINQVTKHVEIPQLQIVDVPRSQTQEETVEVIQPIPQDRMSDHVVQQTVKELRSKFGHMSEVHARNRSDKNRWREKQRFEAKQYP